MNKKSAKESTKFYTLISIIALYSFSLAWLINSHPVNQVLSDYYKRWYPTVMLLQEGRSLYDPANGQDIVAAMPLNHDPTYASFAYPAHIITFTLPLSFLPYDIANFIWLLATLLFLLIGILIAYQQFKWPISINGLTILLLLTFFSIPTIQNSIWGQFNTISVISLALSTRFLSRRQYLLAGICLTGLTFKPQIMALPLLFLLFWSVFERERWMLLFGFFAGLFWHWAFAELFERGWVIKFFNEVSVYSNFHNPPSGLARFGITEPFVSVLIILLFMIVIWINRKAQPDSIEFIGCLVISTLIWWLVAPVLGIMHLLAMPVILIYLSASLNRHYPKIYRVTIIGTIVLYFVGLSGFIYFVSQSEYYGLHLKAVETIYNAILPIFLVLVSIPLVIKKSDRLVPFLFR